MSLDTVTTLAALFNTQEVSNDYLMLLADRNALPNHPALLYYGAVNGGKSYTTKIPHVGLMGYDLPDQQGEGGSLVYKNLATGSSTVTTARFSKGYERTDEVVLLGGVTVPQLALDALAARNHRLTELICDAVDGFSATVGPGSGNDLTVASILSGAGTIVINNVDTRFGLMAALHGRQWGDLIVDAGITIAAGTQQYNMSLADLQNLRGGAFKGSWLDVDWFVSNRVNVANAGADRAGAIWGRGGVVWMDGKVGDLIEDPINQAAISDDVMLERDRTVKTASTGYAMHCYLGVDLGVEAGVVVQSDA